MKILCAECFHPIETVTGVNALCSQCGAEFKLDAKSSIFKVRLDGGYIKNDMTFDEVVKNIKDGNILADEYIAGENGPWITVYDSSFVGYIPKKDDKNYKKTRTEVTLYEQKKLGRLTIFTLATLFVLSFGVNVFLLVLMYMMRMRMQDLVGQIIGG